MHSLIAATRPAGGSFSTQTLVLPDDSDELDSIDVAVASDGALTAVWWHGYFTDPVWGVHAAHRPAGGEFGAASDLTPDDPGTEDDDARRSTRSWRSTPQVTRRWSGSRRAARASHASCLASSTPRARA